MERKEQFQIQLLLFGIRPSLVQSLWPIEGNLKGVINNLV